MTRHAFDLAEFASDAAFAIDADARIVALYIPNNLEHGPPWPFDPAYFSRETI